MRVCACGTKLTSYNPGRLCFKCDDLQCRAVTTDDPAAKLHFVARQAAGTYRHPERFSDARSYLEDLSARLNVLCAAVGFPTPDIDPEVWA